MLVLLPLAANVTLDRASVPAAGKQTAHVKVEAFGRYAITVESKQGVALQIVDKTTGPGEIFGTPGEEDGRIDLFLDRGTYRIVTHGDPKAEGTAKITVRPFRELSGEAPPALVELKPIDLTLGDFEQRSYWLDIGARRTVVLEAAGRNLADLRLWKDGVWLVDREPLRDTSEPNVGKPLTVLRWHAELEPGLYLVTAYGGPANAWAEDDGRHPFHLRFGIPPLPSALRKRYRIGPFGYDRYLVSGANYFRVELPEAKPLALEVRSWSEAQPFGSSPRRAEITKRTVPPVAELDTGYDGTFLVTVSGRQSEGYVLQHFRALWYTALPKDARYWISTVHSGHAEDSIDASGVVTDASERNVAKLWQGVTLSSDHPWGRRFNLLDTATVHLDVKEAGTYVIEASGSADAIFLLEPFFIDPPLNDQRPKWQPSGSKWTLDRGLHLLTITPKKKGVIEVRIAKSGSLFRTLESLFAAKKEIRLPRPQLRFTAIPPSHAYWIQLNRQPGVRTGVVARPLPIDLRDALPITQAPGEEIEIPIAIFEEGLLSAEAEDGSRLDISIDGGAWTKSAQPSRGEHRVRVRHSGEHLIDYALSFRAKRLEPDTPLPPLPDGRIASLPKFPVLSEGEPRYFDLDRDSEQSFLVRASSPALFRLESTGLLATEGNLRTRVLPSVAREEENGVGRNFLVQEWLGTGDYQLTVRTRGLTRGHLGVRLKRTPEQNGGRLAEDIPARATVKAGETIVYPFTIAKAGHHRLLALGQGRTPRARLDDRDGWPLVRPGGEAYFETWFEPGEYRLALLPEAVDMRVVTRLDRIEAPQKFEGHGPHRIELDQRIEHVWIERARGSKSKPEARKRDVWWFEVPAQIDAAIELGGKMHGDLIRVGENGVREKVAYVPPLRGWSGPLSRGTYRLEVLNLYETSDVPYAIAVRSIPLVVGLSRTMPAQSSVPVSIGEPALVEISSYGSSDVEAKLIDAEGRTIAKSDDRPDDWNFHLAKRLDPGRYTLVMNPVGAPAGLVEVAVRARREVLQADLQIPARKRAVVGRNVHVHPLSIPDGARFLAIQARSSETIGLVLEEERDAAYRTIATSVGRPARIELPLEPGASRRKHRIKLWSADERSMPIDLTIAAIEPERIDEDDLEDGETIARSKELPIAVAEVTLDAPGTFRARGAVRWSAEPGVAVEAPRSGLMHPNGTRIWIVRDANRRAEIRASRVMLERGALDVSLGERPIDIDLLGEGPVLVRVDAAKVQPGVCVMAERRIRPSCFDAHEGRAISAHLDAERTIARVWAAERAANPFDATIEVHRFHTPEDVELGIGSRQGTIAAKGAIAFRLAAGRKRIAVSLEEGAAAVLADGSKPERVAWANGETETFAGNGDRLVLLNPLDRDVTFAIEVLPLIDASIALAEPYERRAPRAGRDELIVPPGKADRRLFVRGGDALLIDAEGMVQRGSELLVGADGGSLRIAHGAEMVMAWIDPPGSRGAGLFTGTPRETKVSIPSAVALYQRSEALAFESDQPIAVHVRVEVPIVARWEREGAAPQIEIRETGGTLDLPLPRGRGKLWLRPIGGGSLHGNAEISASPIVTVGEGLGPEVMIAPGAARAFSFDVKEPRPIGIGVRSDAAEIEAILMGASGSAIGRGVVQMHALAAGTYTLFVRAPDGSRPARARPAIVGIDAPPKGPPAEIVQSYLRAAGYAER